MRGTFSATEGVVEIEKQVKRDFGEDSKIQSVKLSVDYTKMGLEGATFTVCALIEGNRITLTYLVVLRGGEFYAERICEKQ